MRRGSAGGAHQERECDFIDGQQPVQSPLQSCVVPAGRKADLTMQSSCCLASGKVSLTASACRTCADVGCGGKCPVTPAGSLLQEVFEALLCLREHRVRLFEELLDDLCQLMQERSSC
jgi:hypothetical protein